MLNRQLPIRAPQCNGSSLQGVLIATPQTRASRRRPMAGRIACMQNPSQPEPAPMRSQQPLMQPFQQPQQYAQPQTQYVTTQQPVGTAALAPRRQPTSLQRQPSPQPPQEQTVYIEMSQVTGKQVITRTSGRSLGVIGDMWVDPLRYEVVSLDLDEKKTVGSTRVCNFPLSRLTQIGDVVLVHDEQVLYDQPMDGRMGFYVLQGMEVRTRSGDFLGKVRDFAFSPDTGAISRVVYDDFGLSFLPTSFFDTYSLPMTEVVSLGVGGLIVADEARYRERRESPGLFALIPGILRSLNSGGSRVAGALTDGYRSDVAGYLPQGYTYAQWENDVRRWEQETGMSYQEYTRMMSTPQLPAPRGPVQALPAPSDNQQGGYSGRFPQPQRGMAQQQQPGYNQGMNNGYPQSVPQYGNANNQQVSRPGYDPRARPVNRSRMPQPNVGGQPPQQPPRPKQYDNRSAGQPGWPSNPNQQPPAQARPPQANPPNPNQQPQRMPAPQQYPPYPNQSVNPNPYQSQNGFQSQPPANQAAEQQQQIRQQPPQPQPNGVVYKETNITQQSTQGQSVEQWTNSEVKDTNA